MIRDQPHQPLVGPVLVTKEPCAVQRVEPGHGQPRCVPDIVEGGGSDQEAGVFSEDWTDLGRAFRYSSCVRPSTREHCAELAFRDPRRPSLDQVTHAFSLPGAGAAQASLVDAVPKKGNSASASVTLTLT
ncbi:hypothetical protein GCM10010145_50860 [Streptomyces ruber]|uniref:Uncharacterized protein n=2 Tax=Streptomyces TaxID=1883 RepID=A0A918BLF4_9ACTN|nr:hypothetical protein GCM10010145_50860 [Streptomyces ruber]